jgi:sorbitol-specific phosphotransferase system component IIC
LLGVGLVGLAELLPMPAVARRPVAILLAGAVGAGLMLVTSGAGAAAPVVSGVVAAFAAVSAVVAVAAVDRMAAEASDNSVSVLTPLRVTLPIVMAAPVSYVLGRILLG